MSVFVDIIKAIFDIAKPVTSLILILSLSAVLFFFVPSAFFASPEAVKKFQDEFRIACHQAKGYPGGRWNFTVELENDLIYKSFWISKANGSIYDIQSNRCRGQFGRGTYLPSIMPGIAVSSCYIDPCDESKYCSQSVGAVSNDGCELTTEGLGFENCAANLSIYTPDVMKSEDFMCEATLQQLDRKTASQKRNKITAHWSGNRPYWFQFWAY